MTNRRGGGHRRISVRLQQRPLPPIVDSGDEGSDGDWAVWNPSRTVRKVTRWLYRAAIVAGDAGIIFVMTMVPFSVLAAVLYAVCSRRCGSGRETSPLGGSV